MLHLDAMIIRHTPPPEQTGALSDTVHEQVQVVVPEEVDMPLPRETVEQIAVPASINGRDLSQGQP